MNLSSRTLKELFSKLRSRGGSGDHGVIHPLREWFVSLVVAVLLVLVGAGWATQVYWRYDQMVKNPNFLETASTPTYREAMVKQALTLLEQRKQQYTILEKRLRGEEVDEGVATEVVPPVATTTTASSSPVVNTPIEPETPATSTVPAEAEVAPVGAVEVAN